MRRVLLIAAALTIPFSAATLAFGGVAGAHTVKTTCTTITGTVSGTITLSGCTGGSTGGSSQPVATSSLASGGTFTWINGNTTTFGAPTLKSSKTLTKTCVKKYGAGSTEESAKGTVTGQSGTGDSPIPGVFKAEVCIDSAGNIHALKPATTS
jgi:hypothetical protein